jgi:hypothetical protein
MLRRLERLPPESISLAELSTKNAELAQGVEQLETELGETDAAAPVVPRRVAERIESLPIEVIESAWKPPAPVGPVIASEETQGSTAAQ